MSEMFTSDDRIWLRALFEQQVNVVIEANQEELHFLLDLRIESLVLLDILNHIEKRLSVKFTPDEILESLSFRGLVETLGRKLNQS